MKSVDGIQVAEYCARKLGIDLAALIAATAYWADPTLARDPVYPNSRRARHGEKRRTIDASGAKLDDNSVANRAIKQALSSAGKFEKFSACHIWEDTCYDTRYHTLLANLVLVPSELSSLTDYNQHVKDCLKYRAWDLYHWKPEHSNEPKRPKNYPSNWRNPEPASKSTQDRSSNRATRTPSQATALPIFFHPEEKDDFKAALIKQREASIDVYVDGEVKETVPWKIHRFNENSNLVGNLRSRPNFRSPQWTKLGITKIVVRVGNDGETR